jgi:hypothetical protein
MKKLLWDAFRVIYPLAAILVLCITVLGAIQHAGFVDTLGLVALVVGAAVGLFCILVLLYLSIAKKSRFVGVSVYGSVLITIGLWLASGLHGELGSGDVFAMLLVSLAVYGSAVIWALATPTFTRTIPAASLTLAALITLYVTR